VAPVVAAAAELRLAGDRLELAGVGLETEVAAADVDDLAGLDRLDHAARVAVGAVEPVVEAPDQAVDAVLLIALPEAGEEHFLLDRATNRLCIEDVRRARDNHALAVGRDAGGIAELVEEHRGLVVRAVATLGPLEELDA